MRDQGDNADKAWDPERFYLERLDEVPDWIWEVDAAGVITYSNRVSENVLGYSSCDIVGRLVFDFLAPDDRPECETLFHEAKKNKRRIKNVISHFFTKEGGVKTLEVSCVPILHRRKLMGFRGIARDVTDRMALQRTAEEALANYKAATDDSPSGIIIVQNEQVVYANPRMLELMGYTLEEARRVDLWQVIHPEDRERIQQIYDQRACPASRLQVSMN